MLLGRNQMSKALHLHYIECLIKQHFLELFFPSKFIIGMVCFTCTFSFFAVKLCDEYVQNKS